MKYEENKKIKNAHKVEFSGIKFRSKLEAMVYKVLTERKLNPKYEETVFTFVPRMRPEIPFFRRIRKVFGVDMVPVKPITYTPDFIFEHNGIKVIIEAKGFENDVYPVKRNLFRRYLETLNDPIMFFEIRTKKELLQALSIVENESPQTYKLWKMLNYLPELYIPKSLTMLLNRNWLELEKLVDKVIKMTENGKLKDTNITLLNELKQHIPNEKTL